MVSPSSQNRSTVTYTPYGFQKDLRHSGALFFAGERLDTAGGGYLLGNGYRLYRPALLRFVSADDISPFGEGGLNAYAYCAGDPINKHDPSGHKPVWLMALYKGLGISQHKAEPSGLTKVLKDFGLPKDDLKFHLKSLAQPSAKGARMLVNKLEGDQFITYRFTGDYPKVTGEQIHVRPRAQTAGVFFRKGNIHIEPPSFDHPGNHLTSRGYERVELSSDTHAFIHVAQPFAAPRVSLDRQLPGVSQRVRAEPNLYVDVEVLRRT
ncbi:RHS repeat-associated core domain-containing protein [Pseudomonas sp. 51_B]|uniref:RHS repeat-associated core domain-containing protein n=1 Tax=Pseudomonas sp. 51_B TaxID=2813573 RepID=UPI00325FCDB6